LVFSYNKQADTYTLTGIGTSYTAKSTGGQGVPFVPVAGGANVGPDSTFGFLDGRVTHANGRTQVVPNQGVVPFGTPKPDDSSAWLTAPKLRSKRLEIGSTFSVGNQQAQVKLTPGAGSHVYSAMLVE
jgi:hypothetical protein